MKEHVAVDPSDVTSWNTAAQEVRLAVFTGALNVTTTFSPANKDNVYQYLFTYCGHVIRVRKGRPILL